MMFCFVEMGKILGLRNTIWWMGNNPQELMAQIDLTHRNKNQRSKYNITNYSFIITYTLHLFQFLSYCLLVPATTEEKVII